MSPTIMIEAGLTSVFLCVQEPMAYARLRVCIAESEHLVLAGDIQQGDQLLAVIAEKMPNVVVLEAAAINNVASKFASFLRVKSPFTRILVLDFDGSVQDLLPLVRHGVYGACSSHTDLHVLELAIMSVAQSCVWFRPAANTSQTRVDLSSKREQRMH